MTGEKKNGVKAVWAGIIIAIIGPMFTLYGQFRVMQSRVDDIRSEADADRHAVMDRLDRLEEEVQDLKTAIADDLAVKLQQGGHR